MLQIKINHSVWYEWHIGEPIPDGLGQVVTLQADGHELQLLLLALQSEELAREVYGK